MLLHIVARGKIGRSPEAELVQRYVKRIAWPTKVTELPERGGNLTDILEDLERQLIVQTLEREQGSQTRAADALGIKRTTLRYKMDKYGL